MEISLEWYEILLLAIAGLLAGVINILAGSGSIFTLGIMSFFNIPGLVANGSNRLGILLFGLTGSYKFYKKGQLQVRKALIPLVIAISGAIIGAYIGTLVSNDGFEFILGFVFLGFLFIVLKEPQKKWKPSSSLKPFVNLMMFPLGFYAGFIQVGTGIVLLVLLKMLWGEQYQKLNPIKVFIITALNIVAFIIYAGSNMVMWEAALALSIGQIVGANIGVSVNSMRRNLEPAIKIVLVFVLIMSIIKLWWI